MVGAHLSRLKGGDTEFSGLRDYLPDDDYRRIDWRSTAKRNKLTVRDYEIERDQGIYLMIDCGRSMASEWDRFTALDHALNAALMIAQVALRRGDQVGLLAFDSEVRRFLPLASGMKTARTIIDAVYDLNPETVEPNYEAAFRTFQAQVKKRSLVILITQTIDEESGQRIQRLSRSLLPHHLPLVVMLRDNDLQQTAHSFAQNELQFCHQAAAGELLLWRSRICEELSRAGVIAVDVEPQQPTAALINRYLEAKAAGLL